MITNNIWANFAFGALGVILALKFTMPLLKSYISSDFFLFIVSLFLTYVVMLVVVYIIRSVYKKVVSK